MAERLNLEGLRYAHAVAETGSFSAAARAYGVTQPALSNGIAKLEEHLGERLFTRSPRGVTPTSFGTHMLPLVETAIAALNDIAAESKRWSGPSIRSIRMGVSPLIHSKLVARAYSALRSLAADRGPERMVLREGNLAELRYLLISNELDIIVVPSVAPMPRYEHRVIDSEAVVLIEPFAQSSQPASLRELAEKQLILLPDTCGLTAFTRDLLSAQNLPVRAYPGEASSYRVLEEWSALGLGSAVLPQSKLTGETTTSRTIVDQDETTVEIFYEAVWDPASPMTSALRKLADRMLQSGDRRPAA
jgi:DNA-binding transcriptional LysR family regulator